MKKEKFGEIKDPRDGKVYKTVKVGDQVWMAENLVYEPKYGNYWAYDDDSRNISKYGYLYDWKAACKVCPDGLHLPSLVEFQELIDYLGGEEIAGYKMKSNYGWSNTGRGSNSSGFSGLPGGFLLFFDVSHDEHFVSIRFSALWWSSKEFDERSAWSCSLSEIHNRSNLSDSPKLLGHSVRCLRD